MSNQGPQDKPAITTQTQRELCVGGTQQNHLATLESDIGPLRPEEGHRGAAQTRTGATSHDDGQPHPSASPFLMAVTVAGSAQWRMGEAAQQLPQAAVCS